MTRTHRRSAACAASAVLLVLLAAGCDADEPDRAEDDVPMTLAVVWEEHALAAGSLDTCGAVAVKSDPGEDLQVALVDEDRVVVPEVTPPTGSDVVIRRD